MIFAPIPAGGLPQGAASTLPGGFGAPGPRPLNPRPYGCVPGVRSTDFAAAGRKLSVDSWTRGIGALTRISVTVWKSK